MSNFGLPPQSNMVGFNPTPHQPFSGAGMPGFMSNPMLQMAMAMYLPAKVGQGNFLPHLAPAQHLFDQYNASQYQNARMQGLANISDIDQQAMTANFLTMRRAVTDQPATAMNVRQASNFAGMFNDPMAKMFMSQLMGPEMMEDVFFGQKGSAENLYQSVARTGFFRNDPTGGRRMSAESLGGVTREMFAQMYGPGADISEMNGISAGRAGQLYEDLFRRGTLPQSLGQMSAADRVKLIGRELPADDETLTRLARDFSREQLTTSNQKYAGDKTFSQLARPQQEELINEVLDNNKQRLKTTFDAIRAGKESPAELEQMAGFSQAARSIDASQITKVLKDHTGAVAAVREIFGEAGNPNAPFAQLQNALEALSQNQVGRVNPQKLEKSVRELQMAARGAGVGLQGMLGLSTQTAAFGDRFGLDRSLAMDSTTAGLNQSAAMRDAGAFDRGFGSMTPEEANVKGAYLAQATKASATMNLLYVARRSVTENRDEHYDAEGKPKTAVAAMLEAIDNKKDEFVDPKTGKKRSWQEMMTSGDQTVALHDVLDDSQSSAMTNSLLMDRQGNQAFASTFRDMSASLNRSDIIGMLKAQVSQQIAVDDKTISEDDRDRLAKAQAVALLDATRGRAADGTRITDENRNEQFEKSMRAELTASEEKRLADPANPDHIADPETRAAEAQRRAGALYERRLASAHGNTRGEKTSKLVADANRGAEAIAAGAGMSRNNLIDMYGKAVVENKERRDRENAERADQMSLFGSAQPAFLARARDQLVDGAANANIEDVVRSMLGVLPAAAIEASMRPGVESITKGAINDWRTGDEAGRRRSVEILEGLSAGSGDKFERGLLRDAERRLGIKAGKATEEDAAAIEELTAALKSGDSDRVADAMKTRSPTEIADAQKAAQQYAQMDKTGRGVDPSNDAVSQVEARHKLLQDIVKEASADDSTLSDLKLSKQGEKLIELSKLDFGVAADRAKLEAAFGGDDEMLALDRFKELTESGTNLVKDKGAGSKVRKLVEDYNKTGDAAADTAADTAASATSSAVEGVAGLAASVTKATPALDGITKAAEETAKALGGLPAIIALIGPDKIIDAATAAATDMASKGVAATLDAATTGGVNTPAATGLIAAATEMAVAGELRLVGLDKVIMNSRGIQLETTPGNGAGVATTPVNTLPR